MAIVIFVLGSVFGAGMVICWALCAGKEKEDEDSE